MARLAVLLLLLCGVARRGHAQAGSPGGRLQFRVYDEKGRLIGPGQRHSRCFAEGAAGALPPLTHTPDNYWEYAVANGRVPDGFTVVVAQGRDTMRLRGLDYFGAETVRLDSLPFRPGAFRLPVAYQGLVNARFAPAAFPDLTPYLLRPENGPNDAVTAESLPATTAPDSAGAALRWPTAPDPTGLTIFAPGPARRPLVRHLQGRLTGAAQAGTALALLLQTPRSVVLHSADAGATWHLYRVEDHHVATWKKEVVQTDELTLDKIWFTPGGELRAAGRRRVEFRQQQDGPGIFRLHLGLDTASADYRRARTAAQADLRAVAAAAVAARQREVLAVTEALNHQKYPLHFPARLQQSRFGQRSPYPTDGPVLTLAQGQFTFAGTAWRDTPDAFLNSRAAPYDSHGTYTRTDSTITFREADPKRFKLDSTVGFYPAGTYYYWFSQDALVLFKWEPRLDDGIGLSLRFLPETAAPK